jgi:acyl-CoA thioester hydrolase
VITSHLLITARYAETNQMGIVADASYPRWMDMARAAMLKEQGFDYRVFENLGYLIPVLEIGLIFHQPAYYDDTLQVVTTLRSRPTFRIRLDYEFRRDDVLLASCHSVQGFVNRRHRPVRPPPEFLAKVDVAFPRVASDETGPLQNSTAGP